MKTNPRNSLLRCPVLFQTSDGLVDEITFRQEYLHKKETSNLKVIVDIDRAKKEMPKDYQEYITLVDDLSTEEKIEAFGLGEAFVAILAQMRDIDILKGWEVKWRHISQRSTGTFGVIKSKYFAFLILVDLEGTIKEFLLCSIEVQENGEYHFRSEDGRRWNQELVASPDIVTATMSANKRGFGF